MQDMGKLSFIILSLVLNRDQHPITLPMLGTHCLSSGVSYFKKPLWKGGFHVVYLAPLRGNLSCFTHPSYLSPKHATIYSVRIHFATHNSLCMWKLGISVLNHIVFSPRISLYRY